MDSVGLLHERIEGLAEKVDTVVDRVNDVSTDVKVIRKICATRELTCAKKVRGTDRILRGDGSKNGVLSRLSLLEQRRGAREKLTYIVIGGSLTAAFSLIIAVVVSFLN